MTKFYNLFLVGTRCPLKVPIVGFFGKFSQARNTEVFPKLQHWFFNQINVDNITIDFDSTVITRYGEQEGSAKGYNLNKKGRNSHHPLMALVSQTRMIANAWLRPGNTEDSSGCKAFMEETFMRFKR